MWAPLFISKVIPESVSEEAGQAGQERKES